MGRARQIASAENMDRILLDASAASTDEGEHLLLDASAASTDVGFFINTEVGTTETPPEGFVIESSLASNAVTNTKVADDAISVAKMDSISQSLSNRNLIINGAMNVNQRGTVTGVTSGTPYGGPDRFTLGITSAGTYTMAQSSTVPSGKGFANSYKIDCTTADTSIAANHEVTIQYKFEGQDLQTIKKGTAEAQPITVSFYCRSNLTGTFTLEIFDNDNTRQCSKNYTIDVANDFEFKSITFPADTTGAFGDDNAQSATLVFWLAAGSDVTSGTQNTSAFAANTAANRVSSSIVNMSSSTDNEFLLTGVQFEVGENATDFEFEPFERTLHKCKRYYESNYEQGYYAADGVNYSQTSSPFLGNCYHQTSGGRYIMTQHKFEVEKRASPTVTLYRVTGLGGGTTSNRWDWFNYSGGWDETDDNTEAGEITSKHHGALARDSEANVNEALTIAGGWDADAEL